MSDTYVEALRALQTADDAWSDELHRVFGKEAGDMRYFKAGKGEPGTRLRTLHDAFIAARLQWESFRHSPVS